MTDKAIAPMPTATLAEALAILGVKATQPDCRTCLYSKHPDNCAVWCTNGDRYIEAPKVVLWRTE